MNDKDTLYTQCRIQYADKTIETAWIPSTFAKKNKTIIIGKNKKLGKLAIVTETFGGTQLVRKVIELNRAYPLKDVTDV